MAIIRFGGFRGEIPRLHPRLLPEGSAQTAKNIRFDSGALEAAKNAEVLFNTVEDPPVVSLYRYSDTIWLEATADTDFLPYPVIDDQFGRVIFTTEGIDEVRVTDASLVGTGGYPANYRLLEVPAPTSGFTATLNGTADDETEVPESRYYVCTFVNNYGAEGPPSPPSNEVEWRSGQTVTLTNLPSVPTGNYNITYRRIYRINTGSSGATNYQYVSEVAVAAANFSVSDITQANPIVVTTQVPHGLTTGQEVLFSGLGLDSTKSIDAISRSNPCEVTISGHGYTTGQVIAFSNLGGTAGMDELDGNRYTITNVNADKFRLNGVDSSGYVPYTGGGGLAALAYGMDELDGNQYVVSVKDTDEFTLDGVDGTGYFAYNEGGTVRQVSGNAYLDGIPTGSLGEVLPTEIYDPPNEATKGLKLHPGGFLVGFYGKTLTFSETGAPHAFPIDYRFTTAHDIVGTGIFGNTVVVTTKGWPYLAIGSDPSAMTLTELEMEQACVAKRGIVDFGTAVAYPSPDGLILISGSGVANVTAPIFTRDQWASLAPTTFVAFNWEQQYLCFYDNGSTTRALILNPFVPEDGVRYIDSFGTAGYKDIEEDTVYVVIGANVYSWDGSSIRRVYEWKSKPIYTPRAVNMAAAKVIADDFPATVEFWVDDARRYKRTVTSINAFRLPGGFRGEKFEIVITGDNRVSEVSMATTMTELASVV